MKLTNREINEAFKGTTFARPPIEMLNEGLEKVAGGWYTGFTLNQIMVHLGLKVSHDKNLLTKKGQLYMIENDLKPLKLY